MKKNISRALALASALVFVFLTGCKDSHQHTFNCKTAEEAFLKSQATCTEFAQYYYSCECGAKGEKTFTHGPKLDHDDTGEVAKA